MTDQFFRIKGLPGLDGLIVRGVGLTLSVEYPGGAGRDLYGIEVKEIINPSMVVGDRQVKFPLSYQALFINSAFVEATEDPHKEYTTKNPFGKQLFEGRYEKGTLEVVYTRYDNGVCITILEKRKSMDKRTIYSQNFFAKADDAIGKIEGVLSGDTDVEDLILILKDLKAEDK